MDIRCPLCGEPWDTDSLHELADERRETYREASARFQRDGCAAFEGARCEPLDARREQVAAMSAALFTLMGDDVDGIAAEMEDFDFLFG